MPWGLNLRIAKNDVSTGIQDLSCTSAAQDKSCTPEP